MLHLSYILRSLLSQVHVITFPSVGNTVVLNYGTVCTSLLLSKNNKESRHIFPHVLSLSMRFCNHSCTVSQGVSFCPSERFDHLSPGSMCKCGKATFMLYLQLAFSFQQKGVKGLPTVLFLTGAAVIPMCT